MRKGWSEVALGEVLHWRAPDTEVAASESYDFAGAYSHGWGIFRKHRVSGSSIAYDRLTRLRKDEFIYPKLMAWEGALGLVPPNCDGCFVSPEFQVFQIDSAKLHPRFFDFYMRRPRIWSDLGRFSPGTNLRRRRLNAPEFLKYRISMPPQAEQQRLAAHLDLIEARLTRAQKLRAESETEVAALFPQILACAMTPHGSGWKRETIDDVIVSMDAGWSPQCEDFPASGGQWGVLKTTSVQWGEFQPQHNKALPCTNAPVPSLAVQEGDVLVTRAGPRKRVGVVAAVRSGEPHLTISDKLIRLRADRTKIHPRFLELSLASPFSQEHLVQRKTGLADAQVNISQAILKATPIAYPPTSEQERIVAELDASRASISVLARNQTGAATELNALLPSLLDRIFNS